MAYWLLKSEPDAWSFEQQVKKGAKGEPWTGVRNFTAKQNLKLMKKGEHAFFYHSNVGKEIVGIVEVIREAYPDPTDESGRFTAVDVKAVKPIPKPVTLVRQLVTELWRPFRPPRRPLVARIASSCC